MIECCALNKSYYIVPLPSAHKFNDSISSNGSRARVIGWFSFDKFAWTHSHLVWIETPRNIYHLIPACPDSPCSCGARLGHLFAQFSALIAGRHRYRVAHAFGYILIFAPRRECSLANNANCHRIMCRTNLLDDANAHMARARTLQMPARTTTQKSV